MSANGDLVVNLVARTQQFTGPLHRAMGSLQQVASRMTAMTSTVAAVTGGISAVAGARWGFALAAQAEQAQIAFRTLLGSASAAQTLLTDLSKFAASTPYESPEVISASKQLLAFGVSAQDVIPTLTMLGDVASGVGQPIGEMAYLFGTARTQGRLFSQDINQFTGRGIPIISALSATMGIAQDRVKSMVEAGRVGFPQLVDAFHHMTRSGGQFGGMMQAQSQSVSGLMSTISDNVGQTLRQISEDMMEAFNVRGFLQGAISALERFRQQMSDHRDILQGVARVARSVTVAVGGLTAASIAYAAAQRTATVAAIMFQAAANPVMLAKVGVSLGAAARIVVAMDAGLSRLSASTVEMTEAVKNLGAESNRTQAAVASIGQSTPQMSAQLADLVRRLEEWRNAKPDPIYGMPQLSKIFEGEQLFEEVSTITPEVQGLQYALSMVKAAADSLGNSRLGWFGQHIQDQIGQVTGITAAIRTAKIELGALQESPQMPEIYKQLAQFEMAGATREQVRELGGVLQSIHDARNAMAQLQEQAATRQRGVDMITQLTDQLDVLKGAASAADITLRQLERDGIESGQLETIRQLLAEKEALEELKNESPSRTNQGVEALTRHSAGAIAAIQRGQSSNNEIKASLQVAKEHKKETEKSVVLLAQIAEKVGVPGCECQVADFG